MGKRKLRIGPPIPPRVRHTNQGSTTEFGGRPAAQVLAGTGVAAAIYLVRRHFPAKEIASETGERTVPLGRMLDRASAESVAAEPPR
jgi:hypothetical protein